MKRLIVIAASVLFLAGCNNRKNEVKVFAQPEFQIEDIWTLSSIRGKSVSYMDGQHEAYISFNPEAGTVKGHNGCNIFFGNFKDFGDGKMKLSEISTSKMSCPDDFHRLEQSFMQTLMRCNTYKLGQYTLELFQDEKKMLTFEKQDK